MRSRNGAPAVVRSAYNVLKAVSQCSQMFKVAFPRQAAVQALLSVSAAASAGVAAYRSPGGSQDRLIYSVVAGTMFALLPYTQIALMPTNWYPARLHPILHRCRDQALVAVVVVLRDAEFLHSLLFLHSFHSFTPLSGGFCFRWCCCFKK
jgi:Domain of unknown function (DUF1772)